MRSLRSMLLGVLLVILAACRAGPASSTAESTGGEPSTGASASEPAASASEPAAETPDDGGPAPGNISDLEDDLVPPNSSQISRSETPQGVLVAYDSSDSADDLKNYYTQKIGDLGMTVITTTDAQGTWAIAFGTDMTGTGLGGTIAVADSGNARNVVVTLATGN